VTTSALEQNIPDCSTYLKVTTAGHTACGSFDAAPTASSSNLVTSGAIKTAFQTAIPVCSNTNYYLTSTAAGQAACKFGTKPVAVSANTGVAWETAFSGLVNTNGQGNWVGPVNSSSSSTFPTSLGQWAWAMVHMDTTSFYVRLFSLAGNGNEYMSSFGRTSTAAITWLSKPNSPTYVHQITLVASDGIIHFDMYTHSSTVLTSSTLLDAMRANKYTQSSNTNPLVNNPLAPMAWGTGTYANAVTAGSNGDASADAMYITLSNNTVVTISASDKSVYDKVKATY
jgi:hypothetical protein